MINISKEKKKNNLRYFGGKGLVVLGPLDHPRTVLKVYSMALCSAMSPDGAGGYM